MSADRLRMVVSEAFKNRFTRTVLLHIDEWNVKFPSLDPLGSLSLETQFTKGEILSVIREVDGDKVPGELMIYL